VLDRHRARGLHATSEFDRAPRDADHREVHMHMGRVGWIGVIASVVAGCEYPPEGRIQGDIGDVRGFDGRIVEVDVARVHFDFDPPGLVPEAEAFVIAEDDRGRRVGVSLPGVDVGGSSGYAMRWSICSQAGPSAAPVSTVVSRYQDVDSAGDGEWVTRARLPSTEPEGDEVRVTLRVRAEDIVDRSPGPRDGFLRCGL
jgi:hypothetical protein